MSIKQPSTFGLIKLNHTHNFFKSNYTLAMKVILVFFILAAAFALSAADSRCFFNLRKDNKFSRTFRKRRLWKNAEANKFIDVYP